MSRNVTIVNGERPFALEELFFSTTDPQGRIRSSNRVFERIAGYAPEELRGAPHSIIRHPDMPRAAFRILWDHLQAGLGVAAYVKNRAKDGTYYWVLAAARPVEGGYLSVRLKPTSPLFAAVRRIYTELRELEAGIEAGGGTRSEAMDASSARLGELLAGAGFDSYDSFMRTALVTEVTSRHRALGTERRLAEWGRAGGHLVEVGRAILRMAEHLDAELASLDAYLGLERRLGERCTRLTALAQHTTMLALNVELAVGRLGSDGGALRAVAGLMHDTCPAIVTRSQALAREMSAAREALGSVGFAVALASLQNEMALSFLGEMADGGDGAGAHDAEASIRTLARCLRDDIDGVMRSLAAIHDSLLDVARQSRDLQSSVGVLGAIERNARVEVARTHGAGSFLSLLGDVRDQVGSANDDTERIGLLVDQFAVGRRRKSREALATDAELLVDAVG